MEDGAKEKILFETKLFRNEIMIQARVRVSNIKLPGLHQDISSAIHGHAAHHVDLSHLHINELSDNKCPCHIYEGIL